MQKKPVLDAGKQDPSPEIPIILETHGTKERTKEFHAVLLMCYCSEMIGISASVGGSFSLGTKDAQWGSIIQNEVNFKS